MDRKRLATAGGIPVADNQHSLTADFANADPAYAEGVRRKLLR